MKFFLIFWCFVLVFLVVDSARKYQCSKIEIVGLSDIHRETILHEHNKIRAKASRGDISGQPASFTKLQDLKWSDCLAREAQEQANQCMSDTDSLVNKCDDFDYVGYNMHHCTSNSTTNPGWVKTIKGWYDTHKNYDFSPITKEIAKHSATYTQIVWDETTHVGCGTTTFSIENHRKQYLTLMVCKYGPGGNIDGGRPYKKKCLTIFC